MPPIKLTLLNSFKILFKLLSNLSNYKNKGYKLRNIILILRYKSDWFRLLVFKLLFNRYKNVNLYSF